MPRIATVAGMIVGAFCIYCGQSAVNEYGGGHDGGANDGSFVKEAAAQSACCAPPARTVIFDQEIQLTKLADNASCVTPEWDIGPYQRVVAQSDSFYSVHVEQKHGVAGYAFDIYSSTEKSIQLDPMNGTTLRYRTTQSSGPCPKMKITVVGAGG
ncbi:hypothetical protein LZC95_22035 [Pendulispora brunnea]|uniref:Secreted protein n=1 Tax=Pendulispora brunnea TaxID=2905690 RepID=A0ABZ2KT52_9BACT